MNMIQTYPHSGTKAGLTIWAIGQLGANSFVLPRGITEVDLFLLFVWGRLVGVFIIWSSCFVANVIYCCMLHPTNIISSESVCRRDIHAEYANVCRKQMGTKSHCD